MTELSWQQEFTNPMSKAEGELLLRLMSEDKTDLTWHQSAKIEVIHGKRYQFIRKVG